MNRVGLPLSAVLIVAAVGFLAEGREIVQARSHAVQQERSGGISVRATYVTAGYLKSAPRDPLSGKVDPEKTIVIAIALDAHSGDLMTYDMVRRVTLRTDRGLRLAPLRWIPTAESAHHRAGALVFARTDPAGRPVEQGAGSLVLVVRDLGDVAERILRWALPID